MTAEPTPLLDPGPPILRADARNLSSLAGPAAAFITSPPYWLQRNSEAGPDEIGRGTLATYVEEIVDLAREALRHLQPDHGVLALILGDKRSGSGGAGGDYGPGGRKEGRPRYGRGDSGLAPGQWCGVPYRVAFALQTDGWLLAVDITWDKGRVRPEDVRHIRRPLVTSEKVFVFASGRGHRWHGERLPERGDVWHIPPAPGNGHQAPMPLELADRLVLATSEPGELVVDPCAGSGTTGIAALARGRRTALFDLAAPTRGLLPDDSRDR